MYCSVSVTCTQKLFGFLSPVFFLRMKGLGESPATPQVRPFVEISLRSSRSAKLGWSSLLHNLPEKRGPSESQSGELSKGRVFFFFFPLKFSLIDSSAYIRPFSNPWPVAWKMVVQVKSLGLLALNPSNEQSGPQLPVAPTHHRCSRFSVNSHQS